MFQYIVVAKIHDNNLLQIIMMTVYDYLSIYIYIDSIDTYTYIYI